MNLLFIFFSKSTGYLQPIKAKNIVQAEKILKEAHPEIKDFKLEEPKSKLN